VKPYKLALTLLIPAAIALFIKASSSTVSRPHSPEDLQRALSDIALLSLRAEYDLLTTGTIPTHRLVPKHKAETGSYLTSEQRLESALRVRHSALESGRRYTSIDVKLNPESMEEHTDELILHATEEATERFSFDAPLPGLPNTTSGVTKHNFIFSIRPVSDESQNNPYSIRLGNVEYTLMKDVTEPQMLNASDASTENTDDEEQKYRSDPADEPLNSSGNPKTSKAERRRPSSKKY
jgi:hypothetical protein